VAFPLAAQADFVTYDDTKDYYDAYAYYWADTSNNNQSHDGTPPVEASISFPASSSDPLLAAYAKADRYALSANASAEDSGQSHSDAWAYGISTLIFKANSTAPGEITFNYTISLSANDPNVDYAYAYVTLRCRLYQSSTLLYSYDISKDTYTDGDINITNGLFNSDAIDLVKDTEYKLQISIWRCNADYYDGTGYSAYASATIDNISVNAVPLPSTLLLLGSGLLGLTGWSRWRKV